MKRALPALLAALAPLAIGPHAAAQICLSGQNQSLQFAPGLWLQVPDHPDLSGFDDFTIECWVRTLPSATSNGLFSKAIADGAITNDAYIVSVNNVGQVRVDLTSGSSTITLFSTPLISFSTWHHVAVTRAGDQVSFFVDGQPDTTATLAGTLNAPAIPLSFGMSLGPNGLPTGGTEWLEGNLDEVRIWNVARTESEIKSARFGGVDPATPGLVLNLRLDEGSGQVAGDATAGAHDGTLGADALAGADDPLWSTEAAPLCYTPAGAAGQANSAAARLEINGFDTGTLPGPFPLTLTPGEPLTLEWSGPPDSALVLLTGPLSGASLGCFGTLDVGTPPLLADLVFVFNGLVFPGSLFFVLDGSGSATQTFSLPAQMPGPFANLQGFVAQPGSPPCLGLFTATYALSTGP